MKYALTVGCVCLICCCAAQTTITDYLPNKTNYSPNTAAFLKYGDIPVGLYTGVPQINVPLYTVSDESFTLPLNLSYHAGGIRIEEEASWVGLGWSLEFGGQISRMIRGGDDLLCNGFYTTTPYPKDPNADMGPVADFAYTPYSVTTGTTTLYMLRDGSSFDIRYPNSNGYSPPNCPKDGEPDIFNFKAGQYSGKFIIDRPRNGSESYFIRQIDPTDQLKIELDGYNLFTITTPDGVAYRYGLTSTQLVRTSDPIYFGKSLYDRESLYWYSQPERTSVSTWYLTSITLVNGKTISFNYGEETIRSYSRNHSVLMARESGIPEPEAGLPFVQYNNQPANAETTPNNVSPWTITRSINSQRLITSIVTDDLTLAFNALEDRTDIKAHTGGLPKRLTKFQVIRNSDGKIVKEVRLYQSYFDSGSGRNALYSKRLRLDSVADSDGSLQLPATRFSYDQREGVLPDKDSFNQDYWGYFNGKNNDATCATLVPRLKEFYISAMYPDYEGLHEFKFSDRSVDARFISVGTINRITYPSGGIAHFVFESNTFNNYQSFLTSNVAGKSAIVGPAEGYGLYIPEYLGVLLKGGGQRVYKVITYDCQSNTFTDHRYDYQMEDGRSSGRLMFRLIFHYTSDENFEYVPQGQQNPAPTTGQRFMTYASSASNLALGSSAQGAAVGYTRVREYVNNVLMKESQFINEVEQNYTGFHFNIPYMGAPMTFQPTTASYQNPVGIIFQRNYSNFGVPNQTNSGNGKLIREITYRTSPSGTQMLSNKEFNYTESILGQYEGIMPRFNYSGPNTGGSSQGYFYTVTLKRLDLTRLITTNYDDLNFSSTDTTVMTYNADYQLVTSTVKNSTKQVITTVYSYPRDVITSPASFVGFITGNYSGMVNKFMLSPLVRYEVQTNGTITKRLDIQYGPVGSFYKPVKVEEKTDATSVAKIINVNLHDATGNVQQFTDNGSVPVTTRFAYNNTFPIAEGINTDFADMAYTSFETAEIISTGWNISNTALIVTAGSGQSFTGSKYYNLSLPATLTHSVINVKTYLVSYWATAACQVNGIAPTKTGATKSIGGNTWTYYEHTISGTNLLTVSGTARVDELRCVAQTGRLKTRTFDPYIGVTSLTDENNKASYFEYDNFNRLVTTRDEDWNILTRNEYHYDVSGGCGLYLSPYIASATRNTCWTYRYIPNSVALNWTEGKYVSLTSQADANTQASSAAQSVANSNAGCTEKPIIDYITKNSGTSITVNFMAPATSTSCEIFWEDLSLHQNGSAVVPCGSSATVALPGLNRTYYLYVKSYNGSAVVQSSYYTFTFEAVRSQQLTQLFAITGCPNGPVLWPYTVPAGRWQGVDQSTANGFAQQDINANGQSYVDAYGSCAGFNVYVYNSSTKPNITLEIDDVVYNVPPAAPGAQLIGTVVAGSRKFELLCAPSGSISYNINGQTYSCSGSPVFRTVGQDVYISIW